MTEVVHFKMRMFFFFQQVPYCVMGILGLSFATGNLRNDNKNS